jgi:hypothetical protein
MKAIEPVSVWQDGQVKTVTQLLCYISYDDLNSYANFSYRLYEDADPPITAVPVGIMPVITGQLNMTGADYQNWDDSNESAYAWVADKLNLTIVTP